MRGGRRALPLDSGDAIEAGLRAARFDELVRLMVELEAWDRLETRERLCRPSVFLDLRRRAREIRPRLRR